MKRDRAKPASTLDALDGSAFRRSPLQSQPPAVPDHDPLKRIGGGSYGEVWLARNVMGTLRAVKVVYRRTFDNDRPYEREYAGIQKFEPVSRTHDGFVDILQVGRNDAEGYFYYVMELADGDGVCGKVDERVSEKQPGANSHLPAHSLTHSPENYTPRTLRLELEHHGRLPLTQCLDIGLALTTALGHLHNHGLVHRDIKPSNIIFVDGVPKLADIGLVAHAGEARSYAGTEGFIPPEGPGSPAADLFSLGKVLYEASTGKDRQDFPEPLTNLGDQPDKERLLELNAILHRACHSDPRARYQSAEEMLAELELLHRGESVKRKRAVERRFAFAKMVGVVAVLVTLLFASVVFLSNRHSEKKRIRQQQAHQLFLEGRRHADRLTKDEFSKAVELYYQAIALDPTHVPSYVGLGETYVTVSGWHLRPKEAMSTAKWAITKALEQDDKSSAAHNWMGKIKQRYDYDWAGAEREFRRAIELAPHDELGYDCLAMLHAWMGRFDEARAELAHAQRLGFRSPHRGEYDSSSLLYFEHNYDQAIVQALRTLRLHTNSTLNYGLLMDCYVKAERYEDAIAVAQTLRSLDDSPWPISQLGHIYAVTGRTNEARQQLESLERLSHTRYVSSYFQGFIHLGLGEKDRAMDCLEEACQDHFSWIGCLKVDPVWDGLRTEGRFLALLRKLGLEK